MLERGLLMSWLLPALVTIACSTTSSSTRTNTPEVLPASVAVQHSVTRVAGDGPGVALPVGDLEHAFERAASIIKPSVVSITSERPTKEKLPSLVGPLHSNTEHIQGMGSGVIIDGEGRILTNNHVVAGADRLRVQLHDDRTFFAEVIGTDPKTDLALIRIHASDLQPASLADRGPVSVGQWVMAAGSPFGLPRSISAGIVSAVGRGTMGLADYGDFIQTDAAVNRGNSGGPLIDLHGRVVGINTAIASRDGGSNGIGFAIPMSLAKGVLDQLLEHGRVERSWLGVVMGELEPDLAASFGYAGTRGILINDVEPGAPAAEAGVRVGDIVSAIDGESVRDMAQFRNAIAQTRPGTQVRLSLFRAGKERAVLVALGALPSAAKGASRKDEPGRDELQPLGLKLRDPTPEVRRKLRLAPDRGAIVVRVAPKSIGSEKDVRDGDVLVEIGGKAVRSAEHAHRLLSKAQLRRGVRVWLKRGAYGHFVVLKQPL